MTVAVAVNRRRNLSEEARRSSSLRRRDVKRHVPLLGTHDMTPKALEERAPYYSTWASRWEGFSGLSNNRSTNSSYLWVSLEADYAVVRAFPTRAAYMLMHAYTRDESQLVSSFD